MRCRPCRCAPVLTGPCRCRSLHGRGVCYYANGDRYEGDWRDSARHGKGMYVAASGARYEGEWKQDQRHGTGRYTHVDGSYYEVSTAARACRPPRASRLAMRSQWPQGQWESDERSGRGLLWRADGTRYEGACACAVHAPCCPRLLFRTLCCRLRRSSHCLALPVTPAAAAISGTFRDGRPDGRGTCTYADSSCFVGMWRNGVRDGRGTLTFANGAVYAGHFRNDDVRVACGCALCLARRRAELTRAPRPRRSLAPAESLPCRTRCWRATLLSSGP